MSVVVSFRVDRKLKERMDKLKHINWSEVVRKAIMEVVEAEERKRRKDYAKIRLASIKSEELSRRVKGWSSVKEIRKWREGRGVM